MEEMNIQKKETGIVEITVQDERVCVLAKRLRHKPSTLVACIKKALPSVIEQNMYLIIANECKTVIRPGTFASLLRYYNNGQEIVAGDLEDHKIGENLIFNKVSDLGDYIENTLSLMEKIDDLDLSTPISSMTAARLAKAYGENAADILLIVDSELQYIMDELDWNMKPMIAMNKIINAIAYHAAEGVGKAEFPNILSADDIIELLS